jgi:hypothetical protein
VLDDTGPDDVGSVRLSGHGLDQRLETCRRSRAARRGR